MYECRLRPQQYVQMKTFSFDRDSVFQARNRVVRSMQFDI